jgi:hypothetical protein
MANALDEQAREFFYYAGVAITDWAHINEQLFHVCADILKTNMDHVAIIYYRIQTIGGRITLIDELAQTVFPKPERKNGGHPHPTATVWKKLLADIRTELSVRNQLVHSPSTPMTDRIQQSDGRVVITDAWWASYISATEQLRSSSGPRKDLRIDDVKDHIKKAGSLFIRLRNFRGELSKLL